jgi:CheY-like chemotaxis protein
MWKILVIDDNAANREFLVELLRDYAHCDTSVNGKEGYDAYERSVNAKAPYDVILSDIAMPEMDGLQLLSRIRDRERAVGVKPVDGVPIIMVTAFREPFMDAFKRGCDDYILKPVNAAQLLVKIKAKVSWRETRDNPAAG